MARPRTPNEKLQVGGSRNARVGVIESGELLQPEFAPQYLSIEAQGHWSRLVPALVASGTAKEADRTVLAMICADLATFHDRTINTSTSLPNVDEKDRARIGKRIADFSDRFGMTPKARSLSGVNPKGKNGVMQRPQ